MRTDGHERRFRSETRQMTYFRTSATATSGVVAFEWQVSPTLLTLALVLIYQNPLVAERLLKRMASTIRAAANYRTILGIPNAFQRVFALLNQFAKIAPGGLVVIEKMPTQQEIAIMVNTSRETVSRAIHILIQKGVVEKDMRRLIVRQPEALRKVAATEAGSVDK